jgi:ribonuclease P protein component
MAAHAMFPRRLRLSRRGFMEVSADRSAKRATSEHFSAVLSVSHLSNSGCAVVVSKKVAKSAVARHLLKRRIRAALHEWCSSSHGLILYARAGSTEVPFSEISSEISNLLPRLGLSRTI